MEVQITPEPDDAERSAILEAFAAKEREQQVVSAWAAAARPSREDDDGLSDSVIPAGVRG